MLLSVIITPVVIRLGRKFALVDATGIRKVHSRPIPRIGGVAIVLSALVLILAMLFLNNGVGLAFRNVRLQVVALLAASIVMFIIGLFDDVIGLRARIKLLVQLLAAVVLCSCGIRISSFALGDWHTFEFGLLSWPITIFWIVGITNAVNLIDGLDGLAAGISAIACGVIAILAIHSGQVVMGVIMLALLGSLTGFLFFNFNPAKIFMGDCGSLFLGFMLAGASVAYAGKSTTIVGLGLPMLALGVPIFDTLFSMLRRVLERRSLFAPDSKHIHHRLMDIGLGQRHVVIFIYLVTLIVVGFGMFMMITRNTTTIVLFACLLLLLALVFRMVGSVRLRNTLARLKENLAHSTKVNQYKRDFENAQLHVRNAKSQQQWWQAVCMIAEKMDYVWLSLESKDRNDTSETIVWRNPNYKPDSEDVLKTIIPFSRQGNNGSKFQLEIAVKINGSLESAGHRMTFFSRLLDENGILGNGNEDRNLPLFDLGQSVESSENV